jgi:hypothetical protein
MGWNALLSDIAVAVFGAALTVVIARLAYAGEQRRRNRHLVRNLADDLAVRRAFAEVAPAVGHSNSDDARRCLRSVEHAQAQISALRDQIAPDDRLRDLLQEMVVWCREYKILTEKEPDRWQFSLMIVRAGLVRRLRVIEDRMKVYSGSLADPGTARAR